MAYLDLISHFNILLKHTYFETQLDVAPVVSGEGWLVDLGLRFGGSCLYIYIYNLWKKGKKIRS